LRSKLCPYSCGTPNLGCRYLTKHWRPNSGHISMPIGTKSMPTPYWRDVLKACKLEPALGDAANIVGQAKTGKSGGGGEGDEHRWLKERVANNPSLIGLPSNLSPGRMEAPLPSGDKIDVLFNSKGRLVAVEVKSKISNEVDIARGLFQCVNYRSVMEAERGFIGDRYTVEAMLVVGKAFPQSLYSLKNRLGVRFIEIFDHPRAVMDA